MSVIDRLSYVIEADTSKFKDGASATRKELRAIADIADSTRTPLEKYQAAVRNLDTLLAKGGLTAEQHRRAMAALKGEFSANAAAAEAAAEKFRQAELAKVRAAEEAAAKIRAAALKQRSELMEAYAKVGRETREQSRLFEGLAKAKAAAGIGVAVAGGVAAAGIARGVGLAAEAEQSQVAFRVMLQDAGRAKELVQEIRAFAAATPMQFGELRDATRMLIAFGESDKTVIATLRRLGDVAAGTGQAVGEVAEIYGKMRVQGRAFAEDINQFQGRGIPIVQELAKVLGVSQEEIKGMVTAGKVGFAEIEAAIVSMTDAGGRFGGMMAEQSQTLAGQWSTLKDDIDAMLLDLSKNLVPAIKEAIPVMRSFANAAGDAAKNVSQTVALLAQFGGSFAGLDSGVGSEAVKLGAYKRRAELEAQWMSLRDKPGTDTQREVLRAEIAKLTTLVENPQAQAVYARMARLQAAISDNERGNPNNPRIAQWRKELAQARVEFAALTGGGPAAAPPEQSPFGNGPVKASGRTRDGLTLKDLIAQGGIGEKFGAELQSAMLKGGDLAYRKADQLGNKQTGILGALGGIGAAVGGDLLGGVMDAGKGIGVGVRNAGLIAQMRALLIDNGPVTVGAAAKLKGSQEAFAADQARKLGREQDEAMRVRKEQLKALLEIANRLGVAVPSDITGVL